MSQNQLDEIKKSALNDFEKAQNRVELYNAKVQYLGKTGAFTEIMKSMASMPKDQKPVFGKKVNEVKDLLEKLYVHLESQLEQKEIQFRMQNEKLDLTLPGSQTVMGHLHPIQVVTEEIFKVLSRLGYSLRTGPLIEKDYYNFEALNLPENHPARDMQDTFFVDKTHVLRTHTSPIQVHSLENEKLPLRIMGTGPVFRCDSDISHLPHFHQVEGMCVDENISMADLKGTIAYFIKEFFGRELKTRFRPSFFPFTEPSAEFDCSCPVCKGQGCSMCNNSGWIEIGGAGLINPKVFEHAKVDTSKWQGFAFGFGIERMAIIKYGIEDIRLFPENDLRFLKQFNEQS